ncbi:hypothetical protein [Pseudoflavitalea rhizosphaerae]|uniref:hypothetical protein n=1 Tax=Pseudoflavitalea rhizosphaerae TaxID=1884793 RepID=UPI000F8F30A1|nr:hypothetical protein [Pseudoflavitalea rhizosphaerae]
MKNSFMLLLAVFSLITALAFVPVFNKFSSTVPSKEYATCYGRNPCNACSDCSRCKHCNAGGSCGKCVKPKSSAGSSYGSSQKKSSSATYGQCRAKTKKGTRCSRNQRSGGYCWQHGG